VNEFTPKNAFRRPGYQGDQQATDEDQGIEDSQEETQEEMESPLPQQQLPPQGLIVQLNQKLDSYDVKLESLKKRINTGGRVDYSQSYLQGTGSAASMPFL